MGVAYGSSTIYQATKGIVQDGLVLNMDAGVKQSYDGGTTWRDLEGGNNGALENSPTFDRDKGGSIIFDGSDDRVEIADNDLFSFIGSAFSLSTWLKTSSTISSSKGFICKGNTLFAGEYAFHSYGSQVVFRLTDNSTGAYRGVATGGVIDQGVWTNFVAVSDGTQQISGMSIYKNGVLLSASDNSGGSFTGVQNTSTPLKVGARSNSEVFAGSIATSLIYNRALTAAEVSRNFNITRHRFGI
jgi:hypothetical protein